VEEVVVGGVWNERLLAHIAGNGATGGGSESAAGIQALDERGLGEQLAAGWSLGVPDGLQQEASDGVGVRAAVEVSTSGNRTHRLRPHFAGVKRALRAENGCDNRRVSSDKPTAS